MLIKEVIRAVLKRRDERGKKDVRHIEWPGRRFNYLTSSYLWDIHIVNAKKILIYSQKDLFFLLIIK